MKRYTCINIYSRAQLHSFKYKYKNLLCSVSLTLSLSISLTISLTVSLSVSLTILSLSFLNKLALNSYLWELEI